MLNTCSGKSFLISLFSGFLVVAGSSAFADETKLITPAAPFVEKASTDNATVAVGKPTLDKSGITLGNTQLHWNVSTPLEIILNSQVCAKLTCRVETKSKKWQVIMPEQRLNNDNGATFTSNFFLNEAGDKGSFERKVELLEDGKIRINYSWKCPEDKKADFKKMYFRIFIPKSAALGSHFLIDGNTFDFSNPNSPDTLNGKRKNVINPKEFAFVNKSHKSYNLTLPKGQKFYIFVRKDDVLVKSDFTAPDFSFSIVLDFAGALAKVDGHGDSIVAGINFTECNDMEVPVFNGSPNMLLNPSFESGTRYFMPSNLRYVDIAKNLESDARSGKNSYRISDKASSLNSMTIPIMAGEDYTLSVYVKAKKKSFIYLGARSYDMIYKSNRFVVEPGDWKRIFWTFKLPTQAVKLYIGGEFEEGVLIDDLQLELGSKATEYSGNSLAVELKVNKDSNPVITPDKKTEASLEVFGPPGTTGKIMLNLSDIFRRKLFSGNFNFTTEENGRCIINLPFDGKIPLGVSVLKAEVKPDHLPPYTDFFRINRINFTGNKHKLSNLPATSRLTRGLKDYPESELDFMQKIGIGKSRKYIEPGLTAADVKRLEDKGIELVNVEIITEKRRRKDGKIYSTTFLGWEEYPGIFEI